MIHPTSRRDRKETVLGNESYVQKTSTQMVVVKLVNNKRRSYIFRLPHLKQSKTHCPSSTETFTFCPPKRFVFHPHPFLFSSISMFHLFLWFSSLTFTFQCLFLWWRINPHVFLPPSSIILPHHNLFFSVSPYCFILSCLSLLGHSK